MRKTEKEQERQVKTNLDSASSKETPDTRSDLSDVVEDKEQRGRQGPHFLTRPFCTNMLEKILQAQVRLE